VGQPSQCATTTRAVRPHGQPRARAPAAARRSDLSRLRTDLPGDLSALLQPRLGARAYRSRIRRDRADASLRNQRRAEGR
jgi:hypothetical protein